MSSSLPKRRTQQKENLSRLSNSKIMSVYSNAAIKVPNVDTLQPFLSTNIEERLRTNSKRTARLKTGRKHQLSVEFMLGCKPKEPYSVRGPVGEPKTKQKRKKKGKGSHETSRFIVPFGDFSKSNSLIVFSEKDSTIGSNLFGRERQLFFQQKYSPSQAATLIQKTWRGYLTRKLLDQYIIDEQSKLNSVIKRIRSREDSFLEVQQEDMNVLSFSSIHEGTANINQLRKFSHEHDEEETNAKCPLYTTSQESSVKDKFDSPQYPRLFFKNHKTDPDHPPHSLPPTASQSSHSHRKLALASTIYAYSLSGQQQDQKILKFLENQPLQAKIARVEDFIEREYLVCRRQLKESLQQNQLEVTEMIARNSKIKEIYESSQQFMADVLAEITAILADMAHVAANGIEQTSPQHQPKSEMFTIDMDADEQECVPSKELGYPPATLYGSNGFGGGQLKLQSYITDLVDQYNQNHQGSSELEFLCEILKVNSERGVRNITERCLLQFTVEVVTENLPLDELRRLAFQRHLGQSRQERFMARWVQQISKWEMGTIQQVTQAMESSSFINHESFLNTDSLPTYEPSSFYES